MTEMSTYFQCFCDFRVMKWYAFDWKAFLFLSSFQTDPYSTDKKLSRQTLEKSHVRHKPVELDVEVAAALLLLAAPNNDPDELPNVEAPVVAWPGDAGKKDANVTWLPGPLSLSLSLNSAINFWTKRIWSHQKLVMRWDGESTACRRQSLQVRYPPWLWIPGQTSPEDQNRVISVPTKKTDILQDFSKKREKIRNWTTEKTTTECWI